MIISVFFVLILALTNAHPFVNKLGAQNVASVPPNCSVGYQWTNGKCWEIIQNIEEVDINNIITVPPNCPPGFEWVNGACREIWSRVTVPANDWNRNIAPVLPNCDPKQEGINGGCREIIPNIEKVDKQSVDVNNVITVPPNCPPGFEWINGACREVWSRVTVPADDWNRNVASPPSNCRPEQEWIGGYCRDIFGRNVVRVPENWQPNNIVTVPPNCPPGQEWINGKCTEVWKRIDRIQQVECANGKLINGRCVNIKEIIFNAITRSLSKREVPDDEVELLDGVNQKDRKGPGSRKIVTVPNQCPAGYKPDSNETFTKDNSALRITGTGIKPESMCGVAIKLFINVNNTSNTNGYNIELNSNKCCVENKPLDVNCKFLQAHGGYMGIIDPNSEQVYTLVAPILDFVGKLGFCIVNIDSTLEEADRVMRNSLKVRFGTKKNSKPSKKCSTIDQDASNNCAPVNCDKAYNGYKPYYNKKLKRCVGAPDCIPRDVTNDEPEIIYDPRINKCANLKESMTDIDLGIGNPDQILRNLTNARQSKEILLIKSPHKLTDTFSPLPIGVYSDLHVSSTESYAFVHDTVAYITKNTLLLVVLWIVVVQCCLIVLMARCLGMKCKCFRENKKKIENKFFNYRQDATVTTPLIPTSSIDTETTDFHYQSESSNNQDNNFRYKYYKSVQNPISPDATKKSLSDDILTKCLNRRDWKTYNHIKSNVIQEKDILVHSTQQTDVNPTLQHSKYDYERYNSNKDRYEVKDSRIADSKRNKDEPVSLKFENEKAKLDTVPKKPDKTAAAEKEPNNNPTDGTMRKLFVSKNTSNTGLEISKDESEKEINCHSYVNNNKSKQQKYCNKDIAFYRTEIPLGPQHLSNSTEKETQSFIPRDSIDDFLSKTGLNTLPINNVPLKNGSKLSSRVSDISNKTSKNNIRNIISSILQKKTKSRPSSDPGGVTNGDVINDSMLADDSFNLEILHMSAVSDDSSSNNRSDLSNTIQKD